MLEITGLIRNKVTITEMLELDPKYEENVRDSWGDPIVGECFFIKGTDIVRVIIDLSWGDEKGEDEEETYYFYEEEGNRKCVNWNDCLPIFNTSQMIDIISLENDFLISRLIDAWLIQCGGVVYQSYDRDLCGLLWRVTKDHLTGELYRHRD